MSNEETIIREKPNSIKVMRSTKGVYSWEIKFYFSEASESENIIREIEETDLKLKERFRNEE